MTPQTLEGAATVAIHGIEVPASMLSAIEAQFVEGTRTRNTLGGKFTSPSGILDTAEIRFTLFLPYIGYLKNFFPSKFNPSTGSTDKGNIILGANSGWASTDAGPVNVHWLDETTDDNDIHVFSGRALLNLDLKVDPSNAVSIEVRILAQPDENGNVARLGTGDLTQDSIYDAATGATTPVTP